MFQFYSPQVQMQGDFPSTHQGSRDLYIFLILADVPGLRSEASAQGHQMDTWKSFQAQATVQLDQSAEEVLTADQGWSSSELWWVKGKRWKSLCQATRNQRRRREKAKIEDLNNRINKHKLVQRKLTLHKQRIHIIFKHSRNSLKSLPCTSLQRKSQKTLMS